MNTKQINHFAYTDNEISKYYIGTFPIDLIPKKIQGKPSLLIVNTLKSTESTNMIGHWIAIYINKSQKEYFDSYGLPIFDETLIDLLQSKYKRLKTRLQAFNSDVCGQYCLYFIYQKARGKSFSDIVKVFKINDSSYNDKFVKKFFNTKANFRLK